MRGFIQGWFSWAQTRHVHLTEWWKECIHYDAIISSSQSYSYCIITLPCSKATQWSWCFHHCRLLLYFALSVQQGIYHMSWFNQSPKVANSRVTLILINYSLATFPSSFKHSYTHQDPVTAGLFQVDILYFQSDQSDFFCFNVKE